MTDEDRAKYRVEALNLAYGILNQKFITKAPSLTNQPPTTEQVLEEAEKLVKFLGA